MTGELNSHYRIIKKLGQDGMSRNYLEIYGVKGCNFEDPDRRGDIGRRA